MARLPDRSKRVARCRWDRSSGFAKDNPALRVNQSRIDYDSHVERLDGWDLHRYPVACRVDGRVADPVRRLVLRVNRF